MTKTFYRYFPVADRDRDWGLFVTTIGESRINPGTPYPPATHPGTHHFQPRQGRILDEYQIIYISAGTGWFQSELTRRTKIVAGTVILLFPGVRHAYAPTISVGWNEHWIGFNGETAGRLMAKGFFTPGRPVLSAGEEQRLLGQFDDALATTRRNPPALQQLLAGSVVNLLALLYSAEKSDSVGESPGLSAIQEAANRMRQHPEMTLSIPQLAQQLKVGYRWFRRAFVHHTGLSPHQYLLDVRLARARELLAQTALTTKEVAAQAGFKDEHYFSRLFHAKVGSAPGEWREHARRGLGA
jgi:AraC-like DNA-binding protein